VRTRARRGAGPTALILDGSALTLGDLATAWVGPRARGGDALGTHGMPDRRAVPDHRARLLQALIDHDALVGLRPDVAWNIVNCAFDMPRHHAYYASARRCGRAD